MTKALELGIALPHTGPHATPEGIVQVAQEAERLGYEAVWVLERLLRPTAPIPLPRGGFGPMADVYATAYEPIETLAFVAAKTSRIKLGTSVIDALFHVPVALARRLATLDQLSGGRVIAGLGQGSNAPEFEAANIPMKRRGAGLEEFVAALRAAWAPDPVSFKGRFYNIPESDVSPKPVQPGGPPILIGGMAPAAIERAARIADGYNPVGMSVEMLQPAIAAFRSAAKAAGRDADALKVVVRTNGLAMGPSRPLLLGTVDGMADDLKRLKEIGADHVFIDLNFRKTTVVDQLKYLGQLREAASL